MFYSLACWFFCSLKQKQQDNTAPWTSELAFELDLSPRAKGERSWQRGTTRNSARMNRMGRRAQKSNPGHFDGNKRNPFSSMPQLLFSFCGIQVFVSWNSSFSRKNQVRVSKESILPFAEFRFSFRGIQVFVKRIKFEFLRIQDFVKRINFVSSESSLHRINQVCVSKKSSLHRLNQVCVCKRIKFASNKSSFCKWL